jgi:hypothetical protein
MKSYPFEQTAGKRRSSKTRKKSSGSRRKSTSKKQLAALAKGRAIRMKNIRKRRSGQHAGGRGGDRGDSLMTLPHPIQYDGRPGTVVQSISGHSRGVSPVLEKRRRRSAKAKAKRSWKKVGTSIRFINKVQKKRLITAMSAAADKAYVHISKPELDKLLTIEVDDSSHKWGIARFLGNLREGIVRKTYGVTPDTVDIIIDKIEDTVVDELRTGDGKNSLLDITATLANTTASILEKEFDMVRGHDGRTWHSNPMFVKKTWAPPQLIQNFFPPPSSPSPPPSFFSVLDDSNLETPGIADAPEAAVSGPAMGGLYKASMAVLLTGEWAMGITKAVVSPVANAATTVGSGAYNAATTVGSGAYNATTAVGSAIGAAASALVGSRAPQEVLKKAHSDSLNNTDHIVYGIARVIAEEIAIREDSNSTGVASL